MVGDVCCRHMTRVMVLLLRDSCYCGRRDLKQVSKQRGKSQQR